jgi:hypothetical protein
MFILYEIPYLWRISLLKEISSNNLKIDILSMKQKYKTKNFNKTIYKNSSFQLALSDSSSRKISKLQEDLSYSGNHISILNLA